MLLRVRTEFTSLPSIQPPSWALWAGTAKQSPQPLDPPASEEVEAGNLFDRLKALNRTILDILRKQGNPGSPVWHSRSRRSRAEKQPELECRLLGEQKDAGIDCQPIQVEMTEDEKNF
jgi:hypothetical protein